MSLHLGFVSRFQQHYFSPLGICNSLQTTSGSFPNQPHCSGSFNKSKVVTAAISLYQCPSLILVACLLSKLCDSLGEVQNARTVSAQESSVEYHNV